MSAPSSRGAGAPARRDRPRRRRQNDLGPRLLVAIPAILFAIFIVTSGGLIFALGAIVLGVFALGELYTMMRRARPVDIGGFVAMAAIVLLALYEERGDVLIGLVAAFPLVFMLALTRARLDNLAWGIAATLFGVVWIGLPLAHAVFLRELPHGDGLMIDVLVGTFVGDTAAYVGAASGGGGRWPPAFCRARRSKASSPAGSAARWRSRAPACTRTG